MPKIVLVGIWYCGARCFSLENASIFFFLVLFFIFYTSTSKPLESTKKNINLMFFHVKRTFKTQCQTVS
jgi:hypothetical protein